MIEAAERVTAIRSAAGFIPGHASARTQVELEQATAELKTFALLYTAAMIRESGECETEWMAQFVEYVAGFAESLVVNVRQEDEP